MADKVQRPRRVETFGGDYYKPYATEAYMDQIETELSDTKRALEMAAAYTDVDSFYFLKLAHDERMGK